MGSPSAEAASLQVLRLCRSVGRALAVSAALLLAVPAGAAVSILWDDGHDEDQDSLAGNFSELSGLVAAAGHAIASSEANDPNGTDAAQVTPTDLAPHDVLWIQDPEIPFSPSEMEAFARFVADGRLLVVFGDDPGNYDRASVNAMLSGTGLEFTSLEHEGAALLDVFEPNQPLVAGLTAVALSNTGTLELSGPGTKALAWINSTSDVGYAWALDGALLAFGDANIARNNLVSPGNDNEKILLNLLAHLDALASPPGPCDTTFVLDFECLEGDTPVDQSSIHRQYEPDFGVIFQLDADGDGFPDTGAEPLLEASGIADGAAFEDSGFTNDALGVDDTAAAGFESRLGSFFLRLDRSGPPRDLFVLFSQPVTGASGQIWDIDDDVTGSEQWRVEAFDASWFLFDPNAGADPNDPNAPLPPPAPDPNAILDAVDSPDGSVAPLDGRPWRWRFDRGAAAEIAGVRIRFIGTRTTPPGVGFDLLSPSTPAPPQPTPVPALGGYGAAGLAALLAMGAALTVARASAASRADRRRVRSGPAPGS